MRTLWAFLLLAAWAQASHGCVVISFSAIDREISKLFSGYFYSLKNSPLPDMDCSTGKAKKLKVKDVAGKVNAKCSKEGKMIVNYEGLYIISSDRSDDLIFSTKIYYEITPDVQDGHFRCQINSESQKITVTKVRGEADKATEEHCIVSLKAMCAGVISGGMTALNTQHRQLTEEFTHNGLTCHYGISSYGLIEEALSVYIGVYCNEVGIINNPSPDAVTVTPPEAGEDFSLFADKMLFESLLSSVPVDYTVQLSEDEKHSAFEPEQTPEARTDGAPSPGTGGVSLRLTSSTPPEVSLLDSAATAKYYLEGNINDESGKIVLNFGADVWSNIELWVEDGIVTPKLSDVTAGDVTLHSVAENCPHCTDSFERLKPTIKRHAKQAIEDLSSNIDPIPAPAPMLVIIRSASCSSQSNQIKCVSKKWRA